MLREEQLPLLAPPVPSMFRLRGGSHFRVEGEDAAPPVQQVERFAYRVFTDRQFGQPRVTAMRRLLPAGLIAALVVPAAALAAPVPTWVLSPVDRSVPVANYMPTRML